MGILDALDDYRPEVWVFAIVGIGIFLLSASRGGGIAESLIGGVITGAILAVLIHIAKLRLQR